jgi:hypothetical protein
MMHIRNLSQLKIFSKGNRKFIFCLLVFTFHFSLFTLCATAQTEEPPKDSEPPPLKMLTKDEKAQLDGESDLKRRTTVSLMLMETRLKKAEEMFAKESYSEMFDQLGVFHALVDDTLVFLNRRDNGSRKVFSNFKKLEMSLRSFLSRLEIIRREVPIKYEFYIRTLVKLVRDARTKAVEPLFSDTVVPNVKTDN